MRDLTEQEKELVADNRPVSFKVLILMEDVDEMAGIEKSIVKPDETKEREQISQDLGRVLARGPMAFLDASLFGDNEADKPQIGERILINKHSGGRLLNCYKKTGRMIGIEGNKSPEMKKVDIRVINDKDANIIKSEKKELILEEDDD